MKNKIAALLLLTLMLVTNFKTGAAESGRNIAKGKAYSVEFGAPTE